MSNRSAKRQAELLGMRTIFVTWYIAACMEHGMTYRNAVRSIRWYPFHRIRDGFRPQESFVGKRAKDTLIYVPGRSFWKWRFFWDRLRSVFGFG